MLPRLLNIMNSKNTSKYNLKELFGTPCPLPTVIDWFYEQPILGVGAERNPMYNI